MAAKRKAPSATAKSMIRTSVGFPPDLYRTLEQIAEKQKVSVGWIVRDAADKYIADRWPLLAPKA
jgi:metal-responsive CopG/Arc/MetJ family transcriptional regulator